MTWGVGVIELVTNKLGLRVSGETSEIADVATTQVVPVEAKQRRMCIGRVTNVCFRVALLSLPRQCPRSRRQRLSRHGRLRMYERPARGERVALVTKAKMITVG